VIDDLEALRRAYDAQLRAWVPPILPAGMVVDHDGPLVRVSSPDERGFLTYQTLGGVTGAELDALIARQRDFFADRGQAVEWKLHGHDEPADLPDRLRAAGFEPEDQETVVVGRAEPLAAGTDPAGFTLREVTARADLDRIGVMESTVWGVDRSGSHVDALEHEIAADPDGTTIVVVEAARHSEGGELTGIVVCAGWVRYVRGTGFATLWGGSTLAEYRGRGCYHALLRYRARLALARGYEYLQVDASDDSRPILQRAGFVAVTTTTPYVHTPSGD
jgi:hypothetical protein